MRTRTLAIAAIVLASTVLYLPTLDDYFLQDDFGVIWLLAQKPWSHFPHWFTTPWMENIWGYIPDEIRPFPAASYQIAAVFGAGSPTPNHVINITLHAVNALLVFAIARTAAGQSTLAAAFAASIFGLLPIQAESVAWITGRVDSMPACAYFAAFLLFVRWRRGGSRQVYLWSVFLCFVALFSKQNTITLGPALVLYDLILPADRTADTSRRPAALWRWMLPYLPFVVLTAGYLFLRYLLFHEVAREGLLTSARVLQFSQDVSVHLRRLLFGDGHVGISWIRGGAILFCAFAITIALGVRGAIGARLRTLRTALFFGPVWLTLGIAPILVSGYYSPRHMYLASLGWAVLCGTAFDVIWRASPARLLRPACAAAACALLWTYAVQLHDVVGDWGHRAALSRLAVERLEREADARPPGTLVLVGVPRQSWAFSLPFAARPPFTRVDVSARLSLVSHSSLHCCAADQWNDYTRRALDTWSRRLPRTPVVGFGWNPAAGTLVRIDDQGTPYLRTQMSVLLGTGSRAALDDGLLSTFDGIATSVER